MVVAWPMWGFPKPANGPAARHVVWIGLQNPAPNCSTKCRRSSTCTRSRSRTLAGRSTSSWTSSALSTRSSITSTSLGLHIGPSEAETFWTTFLKSLVRRGLRGVKLVISDAHEGLKGAIRRVMGATWQRCRFEASQLTGQARQTEVTRKLAAWAAILAVPTAIAGIYGMNFKYIPEIEFYYGYFVVMPVIALICALLYWRFRCDEWL